MNFARILLFLIGAAGCFAQTPSENADREGMRKTMAGLAEAFAKGDVDAIASYHHPNVEKALSYMKRVKGRDAMVAELGGTLAAYSLTFSEHEIESLEFFGDTCVELTKFAIRGEPKGNSPAFTFRGRSMVVYVRYSGSPSGWASIREVIQPATE